MASALASSIALAAAPLVGGNSVSAVLEYEAVGFTLADCFGAPHGKRSPPRPEHREQPAEPLAACVRKRSHRAGFSPSSRDIAAKSNASRWVDPNDSRSCSDSPSLGAGVIGPQESESFVLSASTCARNRRVLALYPAFHRCRHRREAVSAPQSTRSPSASSPARRRFKQSRKSSSSWVARCRAASAHLSNSDPAGLRAARMRISRSSRRACWRTRPLSSPCAHRIGGHRTDWTAIARPLSRRRPMPG